MQKLAKQRYREFVADPADPILHFKKMKGHDGYWSVRIDHDYRAVGVRAEDVICWFFIGTHVEYDRLLDD